MYHVAGNERLAREYSSLAVVWQTGVNPVVVLELLARGTWSGAGVWGPESFDAVPHRTAGGIRLAMKRAGPDAAAVGGALIGTGRAPP